MGAKLYHLLMMFSLVVTLSLLGLLGWLLAAGRLTAKNSAILVKMLQGEPWVEPLPAAVEEGPRDGEPAAVAAAEQLAVTQRASDLADRLIEQRKEELAYTVRHLTVLQKQIAAEREKLRQEREEWAKEILAHRQRTESEGFKKQLKLYEKMQSGQVKDIFMSLQESLAAEYLVAMNERTAAKVMGQFRTPDEKACLQRLLEQMRRDG